MSSPLPPPERPSLGSTFKRPINSLMVGNAAGSVTIDKAPAALIAHYSAFSIPINVYIGMVSDDGSYHYAITGQFDPTTILYAEGFVSASGRINEFINHLFDSSDNSGQINLGAGPDVVNVNYLGVTVTFRDPGGAVFPSGSFLQVQPGATADDGNNHDIAFVDVTPIQLTFTTNTSNASTQTFAHAFATPPRAVIPIIQSGVGATNQWVAKTDLYTTTTCRLIVSGPSAAWTNVTVALVAIQ